MDSPGDDFSRNTEDILARVLSLSYRISSASPPMKPFIRFYKDTGDIYRQSDGKIKSLFWDFDDTLQRFLLSIAKAIATPDQLNHACIERWKSNFEILSDINQKQFKELVEGKKPYQYKDNARIRFISERLEKGSRFLYVGCGRGTECLSFASRGYNVIGIDTNFPLTRMAIDWARYLDLPFIPVCMDVMDLGFFQEIFDSFLIEFYGYQTSLFQSLLLQRNLARALRKGGKGFVVGVRKNYASYWFLMQPFYTESMVRWLADQAVLDYYWNNPDGHGEKLMYGLFCVSHTVESLSRELGHAFKVIECQYEKRGPRYVICVVEPKENLDSLPALEYSQDWGGNVSNYLKSDAGSLDEILGQIDAICNFLESHENNVLQYFKNDSPKDKSPFQVIHVEMSEFLRLLEAAFRSLPDYDRTC